jgi:hypothetical protein
VFLEAWDIQKGTIQIKVDPRTYELCARNKSVKVSVRKGFLGMEWVERIEAV